MQLLGNLLQAVKPSPTLAITRKAADLKRQGIDIIGLSQGEPDFPTPAHICAAAKLAIDQGMTRYTDVDGTSELKASIVRKFDRDNGIAYDLSEISVGTGAKQVIFNALLATLNHGDEVIIPAPYWVSYPDMVRLAGGMPVEVSCPETQGFKITAAQLERAITPRTKWVILNSPSNPTGAGYSAIELKQLGAVLLGHPQVYVLSDDIYEYLRYDDWEFNTIAAQVPALRNRTLTVNGVSKAYSMTGWRIGFAGGPKDLIDAMATLQSQSTSNPCSIAQAAATAAMDGPLDFLQQRNQIFRQRRNLCLDAFEATPGLTCRPPEGAFYLFPSCEKLINRRTAANKVLNDDIDFCSYLLEQAKVAVVPGSAFGMAGYFRMSFATSTENLERACERIRLACDQLN